ncbi:hypothetical protein [Methylobacterium flocculans]|uniref:hypothetical protein n=1 Tax=Methylobacterium flocculans TaxID=2984843 RepID=UPI0021F33AA6|nr:hypothetical protein [Methylobacterium sp. FF17]
MTLRFLALMALLSLAACAEKPVLEAPRPIIQRVVVDPTPVPDRLLTCRAQPALLDEDAPQSALAPTYVDERAAGQDCRTKLAAVRRTLRGKPVR